MSLLFESSDVVFQGVVSYRSPMQVLLSLVKCPGGLLLTDMNLIDIFQACFKIGHFTGNAQKEITGDLLSSVQALTMVEGGRKCSGI